MRCAGVGTLSAHKMTTGRVSHQQVSRIKGQIVIYRPSIGPDSLRDALRATLVGNHRQSSGDSRQRGLHAMKHITMTILATAALVLAMQPARAASDCSRTSTGGIVGALGGAVVGGFLGSKIGKGTGQLVATGAGVLLGGFLGNELGRRLSCKDQEMASTTAQQTLETQPTGAQVAWKNPDSGNSGTRTPVRTYQQTDGTPCRDFQQIITADGQTEQLEGTACRQQNGTWVVQK